MVPSAPSSTATSSGSAGFEVRLMPFVVANQPSSRIHCIFVGPNDGGSALLLFGSPRRLSMSMYTATGADTVTSSRYAANPRLSLPDIMYSAPARYGGRPAGTAFVYR